MRDDMKHLQVSTHGRVTTFHGSWYRGPTTRFIPDKTSLAEDGAIDKFVVQGWASPNLINKNHKILSFGSCFARHVTSFLQDRNYRVLGSEKTEMDSHIITFGEGIVNTFSILQQFEWAIEDKPFSNTYWFGPNKEVALPDETERLKTKQLMLEADRFIFTLGVSEIWFDQQTGEAFWRAIPADLFDEKIHGFRVSTVEENLDNLRKIVSIIKKIKPKAEIIFTLSPVPLMATFRDVSCITASSVSKAILRVAIDELIRTSNVELHYFPSYEIVKDMFNDPFMPDNRHPKPEVITQVLEAFERNFGSPD